MAAIRVGAAAGAGRYVAAFIPAMAFRHLVVGAPRDVLSLIAAARVIVRRPSPGLAVALHVREAQALARLGDATAGARALDRAAESLAVGTNVPDRNDSRPTPPNRPYGT